MSPRSRSAAPRRPLPPAALALAALLAAGCGRAPAGPAAATPHTREITVTTAPLLVHESARVFPFLAADFARGGVLDGKEVYAFVPSTIVVTAGDTIRFTFVNPEDDLHSFVLPDLTVPLPGQQETHATYVARRAGIYPITCGMPQHQPMMSGQLVVLAPGAVADGAAP